MKQALQGWKLTVKKIGKGTGKNAPMYKAKARELMARCQTAVPGWIMPINRALESLDPRSNRFDVIIIDEASQADVCALAIAYMAKRLIVVGDDKQVSPMAIGVETDKINALIQMHINGVIPNAHLYTPNTSLYDVAAMTFQPLMLREHFRCVPEIIGFSNSLSYDFKIKPLRDASNCPLVPNVVNYRVDSGKRENHRKENTIEAKAIVALLIACMEQPEYEGKTFGVISLLGDEQVYILQSIMFEHIDAKVIDRRKILCGNASNFQGDERDVVFLSVVDSNLGNGPLTMQGFGNDDAYRKRYNVAASRARDQLWVVHSLDAANDLKPGDIRKRLIDYSLNPSAFDNISKEIEEKSESPFEVAVAKTLASRGYHLVQQWKVGGYRIDMVAVCGKKSVAIECDGEKDHSGEAKIREDMERQTILERIGWRFIRIRGSEYFRNPEQTMERVITELRNFGIEPEDQLITVTETRTSELLQRTKSRASEILRNFDSPNFSSVDMGTIEFALNAKDTVKNAAGSEQNLSINTTQDSLTPISFKLDSDKPTRTKIPADAEIIPHLVEASVQKGLVVRNYPESKKEKKENDVTTHISGHSNSVKSNMIKIASKPQEKNTEPKHQLPYSNVEKKNEQLTFDGLPALEQTSDDVISLIKAAGIEYFDKRLNNGALWIIGGREELSKFVSKCKKLGVHFTYKQGGGRTTRGRDGWWAK
jgi:very-short-patch-repair endonuclease